MFQHVEDQNTILLFVFLFRETCTTRRLQETLRSWKKNTAPGRPLARVLQEERKYSVGFGAGVFRLNFHQDPGILWQWVQYFSTNLWFLFLSPYISSARKHSFSWSPTRFLLPLLWSDHVTEGREKENLKETRTSGVRSLKRHKKFSLVSSSWQYPKKNHLSLFLQVNLHCWLRALKLAFFGCNISAWQRERWNHFFWGRIVL